MDGIHIFWIVLFAALLAAEGMTAGLYCVWFAFGALGALISSVIAPGLIVLQVVIFILLSAAALVFLRPFARKIIKPKSSIFVNSDRNIGKMGRVVEEIRNAESMGAVYVCGKTWTARSFDNSVIPAGESVRVLEIEGVKLIVEHCGVTEKSEI